MLKKFQNPTLKKIIFSNDLKKKFYESVSNFIPKIREYEITEDYIGIRPKKIMNNESDFQILTEDDHKIENLLILNGIESPGLTSSLSIAEHVSHNLLKG